MPHITLSDEFPGIRSLFMYSPATSEPMNQLANLLLFDKDYSTLTPGERELIATYVSTLNTCKYCATTHGAIARFQLGDDPELVKQVQANPETANISDKLKALMRIAAKVQQDGKNVSAGDIAFAKQHGASEKEIHDTVLIAAVFCMFNRYVDGLATIAPDDPELYEKIGRQRSSEGYLTPAVPLGEE